MCPFCYIGKRRFDDALAQFPHADKVTVNWRSFQLNPNLQTAPGTNINQYLAEQKGWTEAYARQANQQVTEMAKDSRLEYHLDKAVVANTFKAHRFIHLAATQNLAGAAEEALFKAYFTEGKNIDDNEMLQTLGRQIGLEEEKIKQTLESDAFAEEVKNDQDMAVQLGIRGVPFFVFENKYAVSGAQPTEMFLQTLQQVWQEISTDASNLSNVSGNNACSLDENC